MKTRITNAVLSAVSLPWVATAAGTIGAIALMIAMGMPAADAIQVAGPVDSGTGGS